ncbi:MAG: type II toxin-antitoxin system HicB family antitoxin [Dehalococcoidia bacterium]|nr:type II toxin-antitoxin system HicB family antitoxin [Dehalococcoidia bacterium]
MRLAAVLHEAEAGGYWVDVPSLPGCFSQGENVGEALINIKAAIELHLEGYLEDGLDISQEKELGFTVNVQVPVPRRQ